MIRPKLSLQSLLLLVTAIGCAFTIWKLRTDLSGEREKLTSLRQKGGFLEISDEDVTHIVRLPTEHSNQWLYRVYVPEQIAVDVNLATFHVQSTSYPPPHKWWPRVLTAGEYILSFNIAENSAGNAELKWLLRSPKEVNTNIAEKGTLVTNTPHKWAVGKWTRRSVNVTTKDIMSNRTEFRRWMGYQTFQLQESKPFTLIRLMPGASLEDKLQELNPGIMIWLTPRKVEPAPSP